MKKIKIYSRPSCGHCRLLKHRLGELEIPYDDINIDTMPDKDYMEFDLLIQSYGVRSLPVRIIDDEIVYSDKELIDKYNK